MQVHPKCVYSSFNNNHLMLKKKKILPKGEVVVTDTLLDSRFETFGYYAVIHQIL